MSADFAELQRRLDVSGMYGRVVGFAAQLEDAWRIGSAFASRIKKGDYRQVVVCGMGGSAIGGDMARAFLGDHLRVPLISLRDPIAPRYLRGNSLVILSSYSGNTGETLEAFESFGAGGNDTFVAVSSGGELTSRCATRKIPVCAIPGGMPPRAAIGYSLLPTLAALRAAGVAEFADADVTEAIAAAAARAAEYDMAAGGGRAGEIARALHDRYPVVYAATGLLEAVARRWSGQLSENAKSPAHWALFSELTHNEVVGYEALPGIRERAVVLSLEDSDDPSLTKRQRDITLEMIAPHCGGVTRVPTGAGGRLARMLGAVALGDFVSVYLAFLNGVDPTPVEKIDRLKAKLKSGG